MGATRTLVDAALLIDATSESIASQYAEGFADGLNAILPASSSS
jgi:hypothetical protein